MSEKNFILSFYQDKIKYMYIMAKDYTGVLFSKILQN